MDLDLHLCPHAAGFTRAQDKFLMQACLFERQPGSARHRPVNGGRDSTAEP